MAEQIGREHLADPLLGEGVRHDSPQAHRAGDRLYTAKDIDLLKRIKHLVKEQGFTLQGAREQLRRDPAEAVATDTPQDDLRQRLLEIRDGLLRLRDEE